MVSNTLQYYDYMADLPDEITVVVFFSLQDSLSTPSIIIACGVTWLNLGHCGISSSINTSHL